MAVLITGIGYIGARLSEMLLDEGETVVGLDNFFSTSLSAIQKLSANPHFLFVEGDVAKEADVERAFRLGGRVEVVYHLAAQSSSHPSAAPIRYTEETNLIGPRVVVEQACAAGVRLFVFGGSIQVYGRRVEGSIDEQTPYGPIADISHLSKLYVEKLMEMYAHNRGLRCLSARLGLVYGVGPVMKSDPRFMTAPNLFCKLAADGESLRLSPTAFYPTSVVHLDDVCRGLLALATWDRSGYSPVHLLGATISVADIAMVVQRIAAERGLKVSVLTPDQRPSPVACSFRSVLTDMGFAPRIPLEQGLREVMDHFASGHRGGRSEAREESPPDSPRTEGSRP